MQKSNRWFGGILLVAGTTIGAGMLALPIVTGFSGFIPSILLFLFFWLYMTFTAMLTLEVNLWMDKKTNLTSMVGATIGKVGQAISWVVYLFLLYTLTTAYLAGGGPIILEMVEALFGLTLPAWVGPLPLLLLFGFCVYEGARAVDYVNRGLMVGLVLSYLLMVFSLTGYVKVDLLKHQEWSALWVALSIVSTSFGFHIIIPSLTEYLDHDVKMIRRAILVGSLIPLLVYISWEFLTLGIIPLAGEHGLSEGYSKGIDGATLLSASLKIESLGILASAFSLFAILTSFLGVSLSLRDFLSDGFKIEKTGRGRFLLYLLTFIPPLFLTLSDPRAFLDALSYAGAFGVVVLLGLFPVLMVWKGRYVQKREGIYRAPGGKIALMLALLVSVIVIGLEVANKTGLLERIR